MASSDSDEDNIDCLETFELNFIHHNRKLIHNFISGHHIKISLLEKLHEINFLSEFEVTRFWKEIMPDHYYLGFHEKLVVSRLIDLILERYNYLYYNNEWCCRLGIEDFLDILRHLVKPGHHGTRSEKIMIQLYSNYYEYCDGVLNKNCCAYYKPKTFDMGNVLIVYYYIIYNISIYYLTNISFLKLNCLFQVIMFVDDRPSIFEDICE